MALSESVICSNSVIIPPKRFISSNVTYRTFHANSIEVA